MRNLLRFIVNNQFTLLFIVLEFIALYLVVKGNNYQEARYNNMSQNVSAYFSQKVFGFVRYFSLGDENQQLVKENSELKNLLEQYRTENLPSNSTFNDTVYHHQFTYNTARVINNSVNKQYNYITVNRGSVDGIQPDMPVISSEGIVGKVESVSDHYALIMSLLNRNMLLSAKLKKNNYFGSFEWSGTQYQKGYLNEIPLHVNIAIGDTIVTSGFSSTFPEGILVGYVTDFSPKGGSFYNISVKIAADFKKLHNVYIITNSKKNEQQLLESTAKHD